MFSQVATQVVIAEHEFINRKMRLFENFHQYYYVKPRKSNGILYLHVMANMTLVQNKSSRAVHGFDMNPYHVDREYIRVQ